jgi:hypothetical protein
MMGDDLSPDLRERVERDVWRCDTGERAREALTEWASDLQGARAECEKADDFGTRAELGRLKAEARLAAQAPVIAAAKAWRNGEPIDAVYALMAAVDAMPKEDK